MRMYDIIRRKRDGAELSADEIAFFVSGFTDGSIPDYQASALAMAVCIHGMTEAETACLTREMAVSGDTVDLSSIPGVKVDKHSTGGVGDKTTLAVGPIVAAAGYPVAKMSGRGLGHTGGTLDKLEAIPGLTIELSRERFLEQVRNVGLAIAGQTGDLVPADKKLYALRDVTATVDSIPLIASSVMSKKLAAGAQKILLDVKCGSGAFMKHYHEAEELARAMVSIGERAGRATVALISNMDMPLGNAVGNALEVQEAADVLKGRGPEDITVTCVELAANMLVLAGAGDLPACRALAREQVESGAALARLHAMVEAQGGDARVLDDYTLFGMPRVSRVVTSERDGWITHMDAEQVGVASLLLGAGRVVKEDPIDPLAGIMLARKTGDAVRAGDPVATLYADDERRLEEGVRAFVQALEFGDERTAPQAHFLARVSAQGVEHLV